MAQIITGKKNKNKKYNTFLKNIKIFFLYHKIFKLSRERSGRKRGESQEEIERKKRKVRRERERKRENVYFSK